MPTASTELEVAASPSADEALLENMIRRMHITNHVILTVLRRRLLTEQKTTANDLWRMLSLRGEAKAADIVAQIGDSVSAEGMGSLLGIKKSAVHKAKQENRLLAFSLPARVGDFFPVFQVEKGELLTWIPPLLKLVGNGLPAVHFLTVQRRSLKGKSYFDLLRDAESPEVIDAMLEHARGIGDAASMPLPKLSKVRKAVTAA